MKKIGFIGLGHMGFPMASGLLHHGHEVIAYDTNPESLQQFLNDTGKICDNLEQLASESEVIITMLPAGKQLLDIYHCDSPLQKNLQPGTLCIDCSTVGPLVSKQWHQMTGQRKIQTVDAPVSGGVAAAKTGSLTFMLGGTIEAVAQAEEILSSIGTQFIHTGAAGSGQTAKICNNLVLANNMATISEAFILAEALGLSKEKFLQVIKNSSGNSWIVEKYLPIADIVDNVPANANYQPGFSGNMMLKDLGLVEESSQSVSITLPMTQTSHKLYQQMIDKKNGDKDFSYMYPFLVEMNQYEE